MAQLPVVTANLANGEGCLLFSSIWRTIGYLPWFSPEPLTASLTHPLPLCSCIAHLVYSSLQIKSGGDRIASIISSLHHTFWCVKNFHFRRKRGGKVVVHPSSCQVSFYLQKAGFLSFLSRWEAFKYDIPLIWNAYQNCAILFPSHSLVLLRLTWGRFFHQ